MKKLLTPASLALLTMTLAFTSCEGTNNSFPKEYVGFESSTQDFGYKGTDNQKEVQVKIIATEKTKEDRIILIEAPQSSSNGVDNFFYVKESKITMKAGSKSVKATIVLHPQKIGITRYIQLICKPQVFKAETTKLTIRLVKQ